MAAVSLHVAFVFRAARSRKANCLQKSRPYLGLRTNRTFAIEVIESGDLPVFNLIYSRRGLSPCQGAIAIMQQRNDPQGSSSGLSYLTVGIRLSEKISGKLRLMLSFIFVKINFSIHC